MDFNVFRFISFRIFFKRFTSIITVFVNKALLSGDAVNLDAPLFVTWFQCIISMILCASIKIHNGSFGRCVSAFSRDTVVKVMPLAILFTSMIATNNLCLKYVDVSFYYIGRSLTTVFNVILSYILLRQKSTGRCIACCAIIVFGFWLGVDQERLGREYFFCWSKTRS